MAKVLNCANTPVDKAVAYAQEQCSADGKSMAEYFSDFKTNYLLLQEKCDLALDLPRIEMPVIEPEQMDEFQESLSQGHIDVKEPVAKAQSKSKYPTNLGFDLRGRQWLYRGTRDGAIEDDILDTQMTEIAVADLKPSQSQIWLEKVVGMSLYFGPLKQSSEFLHEAPIIVSSDGYILDGHHRFGAAMVSNPSLKLTALKVDMEIRELVKMARSYGNAIGNEQKAAESFEAEGKVGKNKWLQAIYDAIYDENDHSYKIMYQQQGQYGYPISTSASLIEISMTQKALADGKKPPTKRQVKNGMLKSINEVSGKKLNPKGGAKNYGVTTKASYEYNGKRFFADYTVQKPLRGAKEPYTLTINGEEYFENPMLFGSKSKDNDLRSYEAESFEAEMDKVVDVDCVNIVSKKSAFTGKDRNFYRVSFRDSGQYDRFGIPAWASKAAKTMGEKYYGVSGCQMVMGMLPSGKWQIQAILIPNTEKMNKQMALKIANHMQDRIEKEGKWAKKKCREDEIIQIYQADEYGAESFNAQDTPNIDVGDLHKVADAFKSSGLRVTLRLQEVHDRDTILVLIGLDAPDQKIRDVRAIMEHLGYSNWYAEGKKMYSIAGHSTSKLDYTEIKVNGGHEHYRAESFDAMSFNQWSQDEMNEELHGGRNMQFKEWLDDEVHTHGNIPLKEWGYEEEHDEPEHQHAETFNADVDTETKDYWYDNIKYSWEGYGLERYQNAKLNRSMKSCVKDWLADNPNELAYMVQDNHEINEEAMDGDYKIPSKQTMKKEVAYLKSVFRKVADEMDKNGEWDRHSHKVNFDAESMVRKPAYGLFGLSFITGILLNMARKD